MYCAKLKKLFGKFLENFFKFNSLAHAKCARELTYKEVGMENTKYLDRLLLRYAGTFDIYRPYVINNREYPAYGYFFSCVEKYVLSQQANLWTAKSYEHVLFVEQEQLTMEHIKQLQEAVTEYIEPKLICHGDKTPGKDHMYSYITLILISQKTPDAEVLRAVKRFKYEKGYKFNLQGYSQAHVALACMDSEKVYHNYQGRHLKKALMQVFKEVKAGKKGFDEVCRQQEIKCFEQTVF